MHTFRGSASHGCVAQRPGCHRMDQRPACPRLPGSISGVIPSEVVVGAGSDAHLSLPGTRRNRYTMSIAFAMGGCSDVLGPGPCRRRALRTFPGLGAADGLQAPTVVCGTAGLGHCRDPLRRTIRHTKRRRCDVHVRLLGVRTAAALRDVIAGWLAGWLARASRRRPGPDHNTVQACSSELCGRCQSVAGVQGGGADL